MRAEIDQRPVLLAAIGLIAGVAGRQHWEALAILTLVLIGLRSKRSALIAIPFMALGLIIGPSAPRTSVTDRVPFNGLLEVRGSPREIDGRFVTETSGETGDFLLITSDGADLEVGTKVAVRGVLRPMRESASRRASALVGRVYAHEGSVQVVSRSLSTSWLGGVVQQCFAQFSDRSIGQDRSAVLQALSFNVTSGIDQEFKRNLQRTGTIHIVSASGAHVMILAGALALLMRRAPIMRHWQVLVIVSILCLYAAAAGFEPPIVRAIVMASLGFGAYLFGKESDLLCALSIAMIGQVLWNPSSIFDIGVQLSFVTVAAFGMFLTGPVGARSPLRWISLAAKASLVATLATAPLTAFYFGQVSLSSVVANILIAGLITPILIVSLACFTLSAVLPPQVVDATMGATVAPWIEVLRAVVNGIGSWDFAAVPVPGFSAYWILIYYGICIALWRPCARLA